MAENEERGPAARRVGAAPACEGCTRAVGGRRHTVRVGPDTIDERFTALDPAVWTPAYLPAWSSLEAAAATWYIDHDGLHLRIPPSQALWCPDDHRPSLRVSAVQSGNWSGPVGSTQAQQPFLPGQTVREQQPTTWGFTPYLGRLEVACRATIGPGSMFSAWLIGLETEPERSGEICLVEVFGEAIHRDGTTDVGCGIHAFRDPALQEEFSTHRTRLDVAEEHVYAVDWSTDGVRFSIDGDEVAHSRQSPGYPMQLILGVFDFPERVADPRFVPELVVSRVTGTALG